MEEVGDIVSIPVTPRTTAPPQEMEEVGDIVSIPVTPRTTAPPTPDPVSAQPLNLHSHSLTRSPFIPSRAPKTPRTPRFLAPIATPMMMKVFINSRAYLEEMGHLTKLDPQDAWLPITESRNGNAFYSAFHTLSAGIGIQALVLPVAFIFFFGKK